MKPEPLASIPISVLPDREDPDCPDCGLALTLHQPMLLDPDRLLGTCEACGTWLLIDHEAEVMARLPNPEQLRFALVRP